MPLKDISNVSRKPNTELSEEDRAIIYGMNQAGMSYGAIAKAKGLRRPTVQYIVEKIRRTGSAASRLRSGRPKKITERSSRVIARSIRRDPRLPLKVHKAIFSDTNIDVSLPTFAKAAHDLGLHSRRAVRRPKLSDTHKERRLKWAKEHAHWTKEQWSKVIWSDESRFLVIGNDGRERVLRKDGEALLEQHIKQTTKYGGGSVMVWGCFTASGIGPIKTVEGRVNGKAYTKILKENLLPYLHRNKLSDHLFQEDNAPCHVSKFVRLWKSRSGISVLPDWPAQSPDLNPIENLWDELERRLAKRRHLIHKPVELEAALFEEWQAIPRSICDNLVASMPSRCTAVIEAHGGHTRY